jgi:sucrose phosphorylase
MIDSGHRDELLTQLRFLYGAAGEAVLPGLLERIDRFRSEYNREPKAPAERLSERDALLISYGDQVRAPGEPPLASLRRLLLGPLSGTVTGVHLLPFYPYSSDDGFSVVDYLQVDEELGDWDDIERLGTSHRLMFDAVINHASVSSAWFRGFLADAAPYRDYFVTADPASDLSMVVRPRTTPLLTPFDTAAGRRFVWTTFGADQVDLDYRNPALLLEVLEVLLAYVAHGAEIIRFDAMTYLWKEVGHPSVHHPKTHGVLKLYRAALEAAAPWVVMLTETNVPHAENVSYFGDGHDEAQMVYNFALPPLVLHSFSAGDAGSLSAWARTLDTPSAETTYFNFLASHDGIGVRPVEGLLEPAEIEALVALAHRHGGDVSTKRNSDGSESPYELNINYFDALNDPRADTPLELQVRRFLSAQAIMLALPGVPGIYVHSLLGSRNAHDEVARTGRKRSINREKFELAALERELADPAGLRSRVLSGFRRLLSVRSAHPAFHPQVPHRVLATPSGLFGLARSAGDGREVYCLTNVTAGRIAVPPGVVPAGVVDLLGSDGAAAAQRNVDAWETRWFGLGG